MEYGQVFTFFDAPDTDKSAVVYRGHFEKKPIASDQPIAYSVRIDGRDLSVIANPSTRSHVLVSGLREGMSKSRASMRGFGGVASAKKEGLIKGAWSFTDFKGNAYKWDVKFSGSKWWLYDAVNQEVAFFERKPWRVEIEGFLFIRQCISEELLSLILLTNKLVHNRVKSSEHPDG